MKQDNTVLIISEENDTTTNSVIDWLNAYKCNWVRINQETPIGALSIKLDSECIISLESNDQTIRLDKKNNLCVWYRRGAYTAKLNKPSHLNKQAIEKIGDHLEKEWTVISEFIDFFSKTGMNSIGSYTEEVHSNKLIDLYLANQCGLKIPKSLVTTSKKELILFQEEKKQLITKSLKKDLDILVDDFSYEGTGTNKLNENNVHSLSDNFFSSFIQDGITKAFEIRIFFIEQEFYAMAIINTLPIEEQRIDYRNEVNSKKNMRYVPFKLPIQIKEKLMEFTKLRKIDTGSIDMIVSTEGDYYFLEVNPSGQLEWVSYYCNYYLEKKISEALIKKMN